MDSKSSDNRLSRPYAEKRSLFVNLNKMLSLLNYETVIFLHNP